MEPLYTSGIVATTQQRPIDVIGELAEAMAGRVAFVGDQLRLRAGAYVAPILQLSDPHIASPDITVQVRQPRENLFNVVTGTFIDADQNWAPDADFPRVEASAYIAADGAELPLEVQFGAVTRGPQCQQLAAVMLRRERQALTVVARFTLAAFAIELFDTISLNVPRFGWAGKAFEVVGRRWTIDGLIELTLRETDASIYEFGAEFEATDVAPNTSLPVPTSVEKLTGLTVQSGTAELADHSIVTRTLVSWDATVDNGVLQNGRVEVQFKRATDTTALADWPGQIEQGGATQSIVVGLGGGQVYVFRARFIGLGGRVRGPWSDQVVHTVASARSIALATDAPTSNQVVSNVNATLAQVTVDSLGKPLIVQAQLSIKSESASITWQQLTITFGDGSGPTLKAFTRTVVRAIAQPAEYETFTIQWTDERTDNGPRTFTLEILGGATTGITVLADGATFLNVLR